MNKPEPVELETDPRFPSGPWTGFFLQRAVPGRHKMEPILTFYHGKLTGEGRDWVGQFIIRGRYQLRDGRCYWTKRYLGKHEVFYKGFNEGKGIWGVWEIPTEAAPEFKNGGFHIWPEGTPEPSDSTLTEKAVISAFQDEPISIHVEELEETPAR